MDKEIVGLDIREHIIDGSLKEVLDQADKLRKGEPTSLEQIELLIKKLAGWGIYIGGVAGLYEGERVNKQYFVIKNTNGTITDKEAAGKHASAGLRKHEIIFKNIFKSILSATDAMRDIYREKKKDYRMNQGMTGMQ